MHLFGDVYYFLPLCLSTSRREELTIVLDANGATAVDLDQATHVITNSHNFEGWQTVAGDVAVVSDYWVDRSVILAKKQPPQWYSPDPAMIFSGVVACSADLGEGDAEVLAAGITALGGQWRVGLTRDVTHLFALTPESVRYETAMHHRAATHMKILLPHWFDDAVKLGYGTLPTVEYEWPEPAMFKREGERGIRKSKVPGEKKALYESALVEMEVGTRKANSKNVWHGRKILLSVTLELRDGRREAIEAGITRAGGVVMEFESHDRNGDEHEEAEKIEDADVLITKYRTGAAYYKAMKWGKTVGTLPWLFHVESIGMLTAPSDQLLHFPIPKGPVAEFDSHIMTITNYTGEARDYIRKLITTMGATFTASMSSSNTVVIAAYVGGNKTEKARNWNIPVVNHTWLEDCFVQWRNVTVGLEKYISFPPGVDFSTVLGEKGIGRAVLDKELERALDAADLEEPELGDADAEKEELQPPTSTAASARDMMEVENVISADGPALADVHMNDHSADEDLLETAQNKATPTKRRSGKRAATVDILEDDKDEEVEIGEDSPRRSRRIRAIAQSTSPAKKPFSKVAEPLHRETSDEDTEEPEKSKKKPSSGRKLVRKVTIPIVEIVTPAKPSSPKKNPRPTTPSSGEDEEQDGPGPSNRKQALKASLLSDDESDEDMPDVSTLLQEKPSTSSKSQGKAKARSPSPRLRSPLKNRTTMESVEIPVLHKKTSGIMPTSDPKRRRGRPRKSDSMCMEAKEAPEVFPGKKKPKSPTKPVSLSRSSSLSPVPPSRIRPGPGRDSGETETPNITRTSKRSAAMKASQGLQIMMTDANDFEREMKRGHIRSAWETEISKGKAKEREVQDEVSGGKKRVSTAGDDNAGRRKRPRKSDENQRLASDSDEETVTSPKSKPAATAKKRASNVGTDSRTPQTSTSDHKHIKLLTTQVALSHDTIKSLQKMGVKMTEKPSECTHVIVKGLVRTKKLLCAIPAVPFILSSDWALHSVEAGEPLPVDKYLLVDEEGEEKFAFKLSEALERAKLLKRQLFAGKMFHITPKVDRTLNLYKDVIVANGGQISKSAMPTLRMMNGQRNYRVIISCEEDRSIWEPLVANGVTVYDKEWLLLCALKQTLDIDDSTLKFPKATS
ncbi:hypothetical protein NEOLEDRAFT_1242555 [Neolentinus lepideus HHB14362 ss-1]|uniref:BRCT domain-containing protein n=1 Tax=Neolentinus lepideus HHB14362 ss-1 TaxID=1314782 RepID=A0A165RV64_9AGAM|nr:hypothetical protein NEOLEDRAFT_1242555 [Neolentinus lepideus HHB14362 ss-1]